jgi:crotonobetainyl-CoA:carnitine CoA-transferase CaiB-like acyl-CoA transferase
MLLADFGAEVIKVEPPEGEPYRRHGPALGDGKDGGNLNFVRWSRGKKSVVIDLKTREGHDLLLDIVADCDILVENFRPGVLDRLGLGRGVLERANPSLIYVSVSGYGHDDLMASTYSDRPAYALIAEAIAGLTDLARDEEGRPVWMGFAMADIFSGVLALAGTLLALHKRDQGIREFQRVDIAMADAALFMNDLQIAAHSTGNTTMAPGGYALQSPWGAYPALDGDVVIAVMTDTQWSRLCQLMNRPELSADSRLQSGSSRAAHAKAIVAPAVNSWTRSLTRQQVVALLSDNGIPAAPVNDVGEVLASPHFAARQMLVTATDDSFGPVTVVGNPIKVSGSTTNTDLRIPSLGEHSEEIWSAFGVGSARLPHDAGDFEAEVDPAVLGARGVRRPATNGGNLEG